MQGYKVLDSGHTYELPSIDGNVKQHLVFVKRHDLKNPKRFPGNTNSYPRVTLQMVLRVLIDRVKFLQNQIWSFENVLILLFLKLTLWFLEFRAARRHGKSYFHSLKFASSSPMCNICGHTVCEHKNI